MKTLDWCCFRARCDELSLDLQPELDEEEDPRLIYDNFLVGVFFVFEV